MAEFNFRPSGAINAGLKVPANNQGKVKCMVLCTPAVHASAQNDTLASGLRLPVGVRFLGISTVSHEAFGASATLDIGIRNFHTKVAVDADGIAAALSIAAAGRTLANNGALIIAGIDTATTVETEVYATFTGANPTDNAQFRAEIYYLES